jgi:hypothetical protein
MPVRQMPAQAKPDSAQPGGRDSVSREIAVAGAHGGAGTTTLAILLQPAWDMGTVRRPVRGLPPPCTGGRPLVVVAQNTPAGAARATTAVNDINWLGERIAVLVVVSDGLPELVAAAYRFQLLAARVNAVVRVPFVAALRAADDPAQVDLPRKASRSIADIRAKALTYAADASWTRTP